MLEQGKEIGALENARDFVKTVWQAPLGEVPLDVEQYLNKVSVLSTLQELLKLAATANSLAEFKQSLAKILSIQGLGADEINANGSRRSRMV